eukprot:2786224-Rhodomonas_salina.2
MSHGLRLPAWLYPLKPSLPLADLADPSRTSDWASRTPRGPRRHLRQTYTTDIRLTYKADA